MEKVFTGIACSGFACFLAIALAGSCWMGCDSRDGGRLYRPVARTATETLPSSSAHAPEIEGLLRVNAQDLLERIKSSGKRGTVVSVWASWCGSCEREVPMYLELRKTFLQSGLDFVFVSADEPTAFRDAVDKMRAWGAPLPTLAVTGSIADFKRAMHPGWRGALPATFLFDATPKLRHFWEGPIYEHEITPILQGFLAGENIDGETRPPITGGPAAP